jgi:hypothetical protein
MDRIWPQITHFGRIWQYKYVDYRQFRYLNVPRHTGTSLMVLVTWGFHPYTEISHYIIHTGVTVYKDIAPLKLLILFNPPSTMSPHYYHPEPITYEVRSSKTQQAVMIISDLPPDKWTTNFVDRALKATGRLVDNLQIPPRSIHFTPPQLEKEKIIIYRVDPDPMPRIPRMPPSVAAFADRLRPKSRRPIYFYNKGEPHFGFTNFSSHAVMYEGKCYPSSEHLYQSLKVGRNLAYDMYLCIDVPHKVRS